MRNLRRRTTRISGLQHTRGEISGREAMREFLYDRRSFRLAENSHHLYMYLKVFFRFISTNFLPKGTIIQYVSHILNHSIENEQSQNITWSEDEDFIELEQSEEENNMHRYQFGGLPRLGFRGRAQPNYYQERFERQTRRILSSSNSYLMELFQLQEVFFWDLLPPFKF